MNQMKNSIGRNRIFDDRIMTICARARSHSCQLFRLCYLNINLCSNDQMSCSLVHRRKINIIFEFKSINFHQKKSFEIFIKMSEKRNMKKAFAKFGLHNFSLSPR